jgi:hypothetical protein
MMDRSVGCGRRKSFRAQMISLLTAGAIFGGTAQAGSFDLGGANVDYQLIGTYAAAVRLEKPHSGIINTPPSSEIPLPDYLKLPESINYDDGDRNFKRGSLVNNRLSFLGEMLLTKDDYGMLVRGDVFYDDVYRRSNDNNSPDTINKSEGPVNEFTDDARYRDGRRARLLDAYAFGTWYLTDEVVLNLRVGQHIAAWGESLFFSGVALAQAPADATKATLPGADVKSILLPVNQISMQMSVTEKLTLLGQYKLEYKQVELNPVGEYFSVSDVVGPGAEFIYGIDNPLYLSNLTDINLLSDDIPEALDLINRLLLPGVPAGPVFDALGGILANLDPTLPDVNLPSLELIQPAGTPKYINVQRGPDIRPSNYGQWGLGLKYQLTSNTNVGLYRLRYHNTTPAPVQNYGYAVLLPGDGIRPPVTTEALGLKVPVTYNIRYFDGIDLSAGSFSTTLFGANIGGELIYREGIDVLVDVDGGLLGPVPTPTRANVSQALLSGLYVLGPGLFWDSIAIVGETGYVHVNSVEEACGPTSCSTDLTYTRDASGYQLLAIVETKNIFSGWDLQVPIGTAGIISGQSSFLSGLGSLMGDGDYRASIGFNLTRLQKLQLGISYNGFLGKPDFKKRPYADRDYAGFTVRYNF